MPNQNIGTPPKTEEDDDEDPSEIEIALCGHLITDPEVCKNGEDVVRAFNESKVTYEVFCQDPHALLNNPKLVIRLDQ